MDLCDDGHEEIVYGGTKCPYCAVLKELAKAQEDFSDLEDSSADEIDELKEKVRELESKNAD